ncbi:MAG: molecular chaperone TorD family protein [Planctomycetota bacterium]
MLVELDEARLARLAEPDVAAALAAVGVEVPDPASADLDELAAEFHGAFLQPTSGGAPPVASLWTEGRFEGDAAARVRELAKSAAVDFDGVEARGAPIDHVGSLLHLWAATVERAPWVAEELAGVHIAAVAPALERVASTPDFYGQVAQAVLGLRVALEGAASPEEA